MASEIHWKDLTDAQKERLVAISRGEQAHNPIVYQLAELGAVEIEGEYAYLFITPFGGALLAERDKLLTDALEDIHRSSDVGLLFDGHDELNEYTHEDNEKLVTGALDYINDVAQEALAAAAAKERGE